VPPRFTRDDDISIKERFRAKGASERSGASGVLRRFFFVYESARARKESVHLKQCRRVLFATANEPSGILTERFTITIYDLRFTQSLSPFFCFISFYEYGSDGALYTQAMCSPKLNHLIAEGT